MSDFFTFGFVVIIKVNDSTCPDCDFIIYDNIDSLLPSTNSTIAFLIPGVFLEALEMFDVFVLILKLHQLRKIFYPKELGISLYNF